MISIWRWDYQHRFAPPTQQAEFLREASRSVEKAHQQREPWVAEDQLWEHSISIRICMICRSNACQTLLSSSSIIQQIPYRTGEASGEHLNPNHLQNQWFMFCWEMPLTKTKSWIEFGKFCKLHAIQSWWTSLPDIQHIVHEDYKKVVALPWYVISSVQVPTSVWYPSRKNPPPRFSSYALQRTDHPNVSCK